MKSFIFATLMLFSISWVFTEEELKLPSKAERAIQSAKSDILKSYKAEISKALKDLEKIKTEETKAGRLEGALAVDKIIKEIAANDFLLTEIIKDHETRTDID
jgi:hypothetical protein